MRLSPFFLYWFVMLFFFFFKRYNPIVLNLNCKSYFCLFFQLFFVVKCFLIIFSVHITPTTVSCLSHFISSYSSSQLLRTFSFVPENTPLVYLFFYLRFIDPTPNYTRTRDRILTLLRSFLLPPSYGPFVFSCNCYSLILSSSSLLYL